ncbi:MAG: enoyl-CoA hydratase-related protein, partial [Dongiaceae bacterium]
GYGLVNKVVQAAELDRAVADLAGRICSKPAIAVRTGKRMFYRQRDMDLGAAYDFASETMACNMMADDVGEGIDAFVEKRPPVWKGR